MHHLKAPCLKIRDNLFNTDTFVRPRLLVGALLEGFLRPFLVEPLCIHQAKFLCLVEISQSQVLCSMVRGGRVEQNR